MKTKYIQIYGIQRAATTFTTRTIAENFEGIHVSADGKHMPPATYKFLEDGLRDRLTKDWLKKSPKIEKIMIKKVEDIFDLGKVMHPIIAIKNPYSWFLSIKRWEKVNKKAFNDKVIVQWYNRFNNHYKTWKELLEGPRKPFGKGVVSQYENLLRNSKTHLLTLGNELGLKLKDELKISDRMASAGKKDDVKFFNEERRKFYLQKGDFGLSKKEIDTITSLVDWNLMRFYGYEPK